MKPRQLEVWEWIKREVQAGERLAATSVRNPAHGKVINHVKPGERRYWAASIKPKGLSSGISIVGKADTFHKKLPLDTHQFYGREEKDKFAEGEKVAVFRER